MRGGDPVRRGLTPPLGHPPLGRARRLAHRCGRKPSNRLALLGLAPALRCHRGEATHPRGTWPCGPVSPGIGILSGGWSITRHIQAVCY
ncbi:hypothetical protein HEK616_81760 (plasmid) [Streptomyces nigrescens]|uniref:Uncharacterized protein n=1 Tax=Streptomyces nigrescens TaxID=1920 RepID=A0ABM8A7R5_STRNI|nr:hypothetical protein HEK616_81760 [Streptomyces nigrescens]